MARGWKGVALAAAVFSVQLRAAAQTPVPNSTVDVLLAGSDGDVDQLSSALREALAVANVRVQSQRLEEIEPRRVSRAPTAAAPASTAPRLWVDCTMPGRATLYVTSADASRVFVRAFTLERGLDPVALELLGLVARSSVTAMLAGNSVGVSREEYERTLPKTPESKPAADGNVNEEESRVSAGSSASMWHAAALYELELLSSSVIEHGVGAQIEWEHARVSVGLVGELRAPLEVGDGPIAARLASRTARMFAAFPVVRIGAATLSVGGAFGLDSIRVEGIGTTPLASVAAGYSVTEPSARSFAAFRHHFGALELGALLGVELDLVKSDYYLLRADQRENVFTPWRVRPLVNLSLGARF